MKLDLADYTLDLNYRQMGRIRARALAEGLKDSPVTVLKLAVNQIGAAAIPLANSLQGSQVTELDLSGNQIGDAGAAALANVLKDSPLAVLRLYDNQIGYAGAAALANGLKGSKLTELDLGYNEISDAGATALAAGLKDSQVIKLRLNNRNDAEVIRTIEGILEANRKRAEANRKHLAGASVFAQMVAYTDGYFRLKPEYAPAPINEAGDGNCLFSAISQQLKRLNPPLLFTPRHLRQQAVTYIRNNIPTYIDYIEGDVVHYLAEMEKEGACGQLEIIALSAALKVRIQVLQPGEFQPPVFSEPNHPLLYLAYNEQTHYDSLIPRQEWEEQCNLHRRNYQKNEGIPEAATNEKDKPSAPCGTASPLLASQNANIARFFNIINALPMELKMKIANVTQQVDRDSISSKFIEPALKRLFAPG